MQALILAGGLGTRLKSVVANKPKALSEVAGKPFLYYVINYLQQQGVIKFTFSIGYLANQIVDYIQQNFANINYNYNIEESPLGTGGAIKSCMDLITEENFLIVNADTFFDVSLPEMFKQHTHNNSACTIALKNMQNFDRYGCVEVDANNNVTEFQEKKFKQQGLINGGFVFVNKNTFLQKTHNYPSIFSFEKDFLEKYLPIIKTQGFIANGYFIDIGIPDDYQKAQQVFKNIT